MKIYTPNQSRITRILAFERRCSGVIRLLTSAFRKCCGILLAAIIAAIIVSSLGTTVNAAQVVEVFPDIERMVVVSKNDLNRLHFTNDEVISVFSNEGEFTYKKSEANGDLYIRIIGYKSNVSLFVDTKRGYSYKLILAAKHIPSEQIILVNPEITNNDKNTKKESYKQEIAGLVSGTMNGNIKSGYELKKSKNRLFKADYNLKDLSITPVDSITPSKESPERKYHITRYKVSNGTSNPITLIENHFYKPGVLAVSAMNHELESGESTDLIIVNGN